MSAQPSLVSSLVTPEAILFDMDGVLVDSEALHWETVGDVLRAHLGAEAPMLPPRVGWGDDELWRELRERFSLEPTARSLTLERDRWARARLSANPPPLLEGSLSAIRRWRADAPELSLAVVSASPRSQMEMSLSGFVDEEGVPLFRLFISGVDDVPHNKPDPAAYQLAASKLNVELARCWIAEDSNTGLAAALATSASVFAVNALHADPQVCARCQRRLNNLGELYNLWETHKTK